MPAPDSKPDQPMDDDPEAMLPALDRLLGDTEVGALAVLLGGVLLWPAQVGLAAKETEEAEWTTSRAC
jgi:hypothetical protein